MTALSLAFSAPARAIIVTVNGTNYDGTTFNGSYTDNISRFSTTEMPWFGNFALARSFASALYPIFPTPNGGLPVSLGVGSFFAFQVNPSAITSATADSNGSVGDFSISQSLPVNFAVAQATPVPLETDALPIFASAAFMAGGLWWKRRRAGAKANLDRSSAEPQKSA